VISTFDWPAYGDVSPTNPTRPRLCLTNLKLDGEPADYLCTVLVDRHGSDRVLRSVDLDGVGHDGRLCWVGRLGC